MHAPQGAAHLAKQLLDGVPAQRVLSHSGGAEALVKLLTLPQPDPGAVHPWVDDTPAVPVPPFAIAAATSMNHLSAADKAASKVQSRGCVHGLNRIDLNRLQCQSPGFGPHQHRNCWFCSGHLARTRVWVTIIHCLASSPQKLLAAGALPAAVSLMLRRPPQPASAARQRQRQGQTPDEQRDADEAMPTDDMEAGTQILVRALKLWCSLHVRSLS